jgi:hypothetical protein
MLTSTDYSSEIRSKVVIDIEKLLKENVHEALK